MGNLGLTEVIAWSLWRRRDQATARASHYERLPIAMIYDCSIRTD